MRLGASATRDMTSGSIVKQIGRNKFAGLSMVYTYSHIGDKKSLAVDNQKWFAQLYFGFRL